MPRLEEEEQYISGERTETSITEYAEDGEYTIAEANDDYESFGAICMTSDGVYLGCVMVPLGNAERTFRFKILGMAEHEAVKTIETSIKPQDDHKITMIEFTYDAKYLISAHSYNIESLEEAEGAIMIWDVETQECRHTCRISDQGGGVHYIALSANGRFLASIAGESARSGGKAVQVWAIDSGTLVQTIACCSTDPFPLLLNEQKHVATLTDAALTHDGEHVITASKDGTMRVWHVASGDSICKAGEAKGRSRPEFGIYGLDISGDSRWMVAGGLMSEHDDATEVTARHHLYFYGVERGTRFNSVQSLSIDGVIKKVVISSDGRICVAWRQEGEHWSSRVHRISKFPGLTGVGGESTLGIFGPVEDEISISSDPVYSLTKVASSPGTSQYYVAYSTGNKLKLVVFSYIPKLGT